MNLKKIAAAAAIAIGSMGAAQAATIVKVAVPTFDIPGLTGFSTDGSEMTGLSIRAVFSGGGGLDETRAWATTGVGSGGVSGTGWGLSVSGDTFAASAWSFVMDPAASLGQLTMLVIDAAPSLTILDTTSPSSGSPGSASGLDFSMADAADAFAVATYTNMVTIGGAAAVTDLFQTLTVTFTADANGGLTGPRSSFRFSQDTDNDSRFGSVPEPGTLALVGLAIAGLGFGARRRS